MHNELLDEQPITLAEARKNHIPKRDGKEVSPSTVTRWIHRGIRAGDGSLIHLEAIKCGRTLMTTPASIRRFFTALTERSKFSNTENRTDDNTPGQNTRPERELRDRRLL